jgi:hypothetical protein
MSLERIIVGGKMEKKTKAIIIATLMVVVVASGLVLSLQAVSAEEAPPRTFEGRGDKRLLKRREANIWRFVKNGVPEILVGEASVVERCILVLDVPEKVVNVVVPRMWVIDGETLTLQDLFDGDPFVLGEEVTLETLMLELVKDTHTVTSYFAYSIQNYEDTATALLPFNINIEVN